MPPITDMSLSSLSQPNSISNNMNSLGGKSNLIIFDQTKEARQKNCKNRGHFCKRIRVFFAQLKKLQNFLKRNKNCQYFFFSSHNFCFV